MWKANAKTASSPALSWRDRRDRVHSTPQRKAREAPATPRSGDNQSDPRSIGLHRLAAIEQALLRKEAALRALNLRISTRNTTRISTSGTVRLGRPAPPPPAAGASDAARLAILQGECASLAREREAELAALAAPDARAARAAAGSALPYEPPPRAVPPMPTDHDEAVAAATAAVEQAAALESFFSQCEKNAEGKVPTRELKAAIKADPELGRRLGLKRIKDARAFVEGGDADDDGACDLNELRSLLAAAAAAHGNHAASGGNAAIGSASERAGAASATPPLAASPPRPASARSPPRERGNGSPTRSAPIPAPTTQAPTAADDAAWAAWREATRQRDNHYRASMRSSWRANNSELAAMRQRAGARVNTKIEPQLQRSQQQLDEERKTRRATARASMRANAAKLDRLVGNATPRTEELYGLEPELEGHRADARHLTAEMREQRASEWSGRQAALRRMREGSAPRVETHCGAELSGLMAALPMYALSPPDAHSAAAWQAAGHDPAYTPYGSSSPGVVASRASRRPHSAGVSPAKLDLPPWRG